MSALPAEWAGRLSAEWELISPAQAGAWLTSPEVMGVNRNLNTKVVKRYARSIERDGWLITGEAIKFGENGQLLDGQHRLGGVVLADRSIIVLVVKGLPLEAQVVMDTGRPRAASDVLTMNGYRNSKTLAAAAKTLLVLDRDGGLPVAEAQLDVTNDEVLQYVESHPELVSTATLVVSNHHRSYLCTPANYLAAMVLLMRVDSEAAVDFHEAFRSGIGLAAGNPILTLRERLIQANSRHEKLTPYMQLSAVLRTWNAWRKGEQMRRFLFYSSGAAIPMPDKLR